MLHHGKLETSENTVRGGWVVKNLSNGRQGQWKLKVSIAEWTECKPALFSDQKYGSYIKLRNIVCLSQSLEKITRRNLFKMFTNRRGM